MHEVWTSVLGAFRVPKKSTAFESFMGLFSFSPVTDLPPHHIFPW